VTAAWDEEYERSGIPSSFRDDPSGVVLWLLDNWTRLDGAKSFPEHGIDIGCGTARNTVHLAKRGVKMTGIDLSKVAIDAGRRRAQEAGVDVHLTVQDLTLGLPVGDGEVDVALDVFVYKHQIDPTARRSYREELSRALAPQGRLLVSLAEPNDGYYASCPPFEGSGEPHAVLDPVAGVGSVLFSLEELVEEMSDCFVLEMAWRKAKQGMMHGELHMRHTLATIWRHPINE
jgi:SAM-dependent methyltransferase